MRTPLAWPGALAACLLLGGTAPGQSPDATPLSAVLIPPPPALDVPPPPPAAAEPIIGALPAPANSSWAWGVVGPRGIYAGSRMAPNGVPFEPVFSLDLNFNLWLWREQRVYLATDTRFWGQEPGLGVTNPNQKVDFSKREFDLNLGAAWNYYGPWEARFTREGSDCSQVVADGW